MLAARCSRPSAGWCCGLVLPRLGESVPRASEQQGKSRPVCVESAAMDVMTEQLGHSPAAAGHHRGLVGGLKRRSSPPPPLVQLSQQAHAGGLVMASGTESVSSCCVCASGVNLRGRKPRVLYGHADANPGQPFFPFIERDVAIACEDCYVALATQFGHFHANGIPVEKRVYVVNGQVFGRSPPRPASAGAKLPPSGALDLSGSSSKPAYHRSSPHSAKNECLSCAQPTMGQFCENCLVARSPGHPLSACQLCGQSQRLVPVLAQPPPYGSSTPFFPFLAKLADGPVALLCTSCTHSLHSQWAAYERSGLPVSMRSYGIQPRREPSLPREKEPLTVQVASPPPLVSRHVLNEQLSDVLRSVH